MAARAEHEYIHRLRSGQDWEFSADVCLSFANSGGTTDADGLAGNRAPSVLTDENTTNVQSESH